MKEQQAKLWVFVSHEVDECKCWEWQNVLQLVIENVDQSKWGLCNCSHGIPRTMGNAGEGMTNDFLMVA